jgi:hypothetical protein
VGAIKVIPWSENFAFQSCYLRDETMSREGSFMSLEIKKNGDLIKRFREDFNAN